MHTHTHQRDQIGLTENYLESRSDSHFRWTSDHIHNMCTFLACALPKGKQRVANTMRTRNRQIRFCAAWIGMKYHEPNWMLAKHFITWPKMMPSISGARTCALLKCGDWWRCLVLVQACNGHHQPLALWNLYVCISARAFCVSGASP